MTPYRYFVTYHVGQAAPPSDAGWIVRGITGQYLYAPGSAWVSRGRPIRTEKDEKQLRAALLEHAQKNGAPGATVLVVASWTEMRPSWWRRALRAMER